ncbi:hypothetical protein IGI04_008942 [Brassica rapa subsp. trilocularis]|uniref:RNase H type-1 domain-containing protein n=1 Tax=Brassica rapa subsp. trilocularis TaxID=1813537 RepID=A0ABQ7MX15_BRACM|nr:hypothetical protein IGI04_008942 [Brassica rapa subsp. trilocularis]
MAQRIWKLAPFTHCIDTRGLIDLSGCWDSLYKSTCLPPTGVSSGQLAPWILWFLWLARNDYIFNNKETTPEAIMTKAIAVAREWLMEQGDNKGPTPSQGTRIPVFTNNTGSTLIQSDAAWREDLQLAGLGWTFSGQDIRASFLAHCHFVNSPIVAEGLALREALACGIEKGFRQVRCESDSSKLITAINKAPRWRKSTALSLIFVV